MKVRAAPGIKVPKEGKPREYITDDQDDDVPETAYYMRRVSDGDLVIVKPSNPKSSKGAA